MARLAFFVLILHLNSYAKGFSSIVMSSTPKSSLENKKVAVIGTTGKLGRETIMKLSAKGIPTKCLLRHELPSSSSPPTTINKDSSSIEVANYLSSLPHVEMMTGDVTNPHSLKELLDDCTACLALYGANRQSKFIDLFKDPSEESNHSKQVNYEGVRNIIQAAKESKSCNRIVRITGTESPTSVFAILINILGSMAKAWNYEGEQLLRMQNDVDYTIIRPGVMSAPDKLVEGKVKALEDNGGSSLKVTPIRYEDIADLCIQCLEYPNAARSTLAAVKVDDGTGAETYGELLTKVQPDTRLFPVSLLDENRKAVQKGLAILGAVMALIAGIFIKGISLMLFN